jgi:hypothetical protein
VNINLAIAERARAGETLTAAEIDELAASDILSLGMLADEVRRARVGNTVTFTRVIELNQGASGAPGASGALGALGALGASGAVGAELRITTLPATFDETEAFVAEARMLAGAQRLTGFSLADLADRQWGTLVEILKRLRRAGGDRRSSWLVHLRDLVQKFPDIDVVNPLAREQSVAVPTTGYDDVRSVALARLALPTVRTIQVDWTQYGPKLAQVALTFGANDLDRVSTVDDDSLGRRRTSVEDVRRNIEAAGFTPVEKTAT